MRILLKIVSILFFVPIYILSYAIRILYYISGFVFYILGGLMSLGFVLALFNVFTAFSDGKYRWIITLAYLLAAVVFFTMPKISAMLCAGLDLLKEKMIQTIIL